MLNEIYIDKCQFSINLPINKHWHKGIQMNGLHQIRCFLLDMDGTFYLGNKMLPGALDFMRYLTESGRKHLFFTNNSSCSSAYYAAKLQQMGWQAAPGDILTSGEAAARYLTRQKIGARVYLLGTPELAAEFASAGLVLTGDNPDFVVLGFDKTLTYGKLEHACRLISAGVPFIATHPDINCPTDDGFIPDCGAMIELIKASTGVAPYIIGKPHPEIIRAAFAKLNCPREQIAVVGDRLYTDIATGRNAGIISVLVLSGETRQADLASAAVLPDYVFANLGGLAEALKASDHRETLTSQAEVKH